MQIVLIRHGKVNYSPIAVLSASSFAEWVDDYNANELDLSLKPTADAMDIACKAKAVVCSELPRSIESARLLVTREISLTDPLFNEAGLPTASWRFPRLSVRIWVIVFRLAWLLGFSRNSESFRQARSRAIEASNRLIDLAERHQSVLFVGHGIMNRLIAKQLRKRSWKCLVKNGGGYWEFSVFEY